MTSNYEIGNKGENNSYHPKLPTKTRHNYNLDGKQLAELHQPPPDLLHLHACLAHTQQGHLPEQALAQVVGRAQLAPLVQVPAHILDLGHQQELEHPGELERIAAGRDLVQITLQDLGGPVAAGLDDGRARDHLLELLCGRVRVPAAENLPYAVQRARMCHRRGRVLANADCRWP